MGCFVALFALVSPRLALFFLAIFSNLLDRAFESFWVPLIGFFVLPWTTLAYAVMYDVSPHGVAGFDWFIVGLAFVIDLSSWVGGGRARSSRD